MIIVLEKVNFINRSNMLSSPFKKKLQKTNHLNEVEYTSKIFIKATTLHILCPAMKVICLLVYYPSVQKITNPFARVNYSSVQKITNPFVKVNYSKMIELLNFQSINFKIVFFN